MNYEEMTVKNLFIEENGAYSIDCKAAVWATDKIHEDYHNAGIHINIWRNFNPEHDYSGKK